RFDHLRGHRRRCSQSGAVRTRRSWADRGTLHRQQRQRGQGGRKTPLGVWLPTALSRSWVTASCGPSQQMEIPLRLLHVAANLLAQGLDRRKLDFIPQSLEETDLDLGLRRQFNGMEVQQVRFNRK